MLYSSFRTLSNIAHMSAAGTKVSDSCSSGHTVGSLHHAAAAVSAGAGTTLPVNKSGLSETFLSDNKHSDSEQKMLELDTLARWTEAYVIPFLTFIGLTGINQQAKLFFVWF